MKRLTAPAIRDMKRQGERIVCVTAYDYTSGSICDSAGVDLILVGDSLGNVILGFDSTVPVTMDAMIHHTAATTRGVKRALVVADLPFGAYQSSTAQAVDNAVKLMQAGAQAVKLEGDYPEAIAAMVKAGIPVMGHLGFTPQSVNAFGGHKVQGKGEDAKAVLEAAKLVEEAGVFGVVLELVPAELSAQVTKALRIPTIGIGAGPNCDGQVQVFHDVMGLAPRLFRHAKNYASGRELFENGLRQYAAEVKSGEFPTEEQSF